MKHLIRTLPLVLALAVAGPALAQDTTTPDATATDEGPTPNPLELNAGKTDDPIYTESTHGDWDVRCIRVEEGQGPCQMYQLLKDPGGNPVAEINVFPITAADNPAAAGATIVTPLETLLTTELGLQVDSGGVKKYPFAWCSQIGCFARLGFSDEDVAAMKKGKEAKVIIVPVAAPDQRVALAVSLTGFTAAYERTAELNKPQQ